MSPMRSATSAAHRADSPRVYLAAMALLDHRPCRMIPESGALAGQTHPAAMAVNPLSP